jgi:membrane protease YdiL (CAAX protease family)/GNAT superfamily N-acetyltransferase
MSGEIAIGLARPEDVASLPEIEREASSLFRGVPGLVLPPTILVETTSHEELAEAQQEGRLFVARAQDGGVVGFALVDFVGGVPHLEEMDVRPAYGHQGIGRRLLAAVREWARAHGHAAITLTTFRDVPWNEPFYASAGFRGVAPGEQSPELEQRIRDEARRGLDPATRVVMRLRVDADEGLPDARAGRPAFRAWSRSRVLFTTLAIGIVYALSQGGVVLAIGLASRFADPDFDLDAWTETAASDGFALALATFAAAATCIPLVFVLVAARVHDAAAFLGLRGCPVRSVLAACAGMVLLLGAFELLSFALGRPLVHPFMQEALATARSPALLFFALVVVAPLAEEILFRGFLLEALRSSGSSAGLAAGLSSLVFAIIHTQYDLYDAATIFAIGLALASARIRTGSLVPPIAMHALVNAVACVVVSVFGQTSA